MGDYIINNILPVVRNCARLCLANRVGMVIEIMADDLLSVLKSQAGPVPHVAEWLPIASAPKDGTRVFLYEPRDDEHAYEVGFWDTGYWYGPTHIYTICPTHWAPCTPPTQSGPSAAPRDTTPHGAQVMDKTEEWDFRRSGIKKPTPAKPEADAVEVALQWQISNLGADADGAEIITRSLATLLTTYASTVREQCARVAESFPSLPHGHPFAGGNHIAAAIRRAGGKDAK